MEAKKDITPRAAPKPWRALAAEADAVKSACRAHWPGPVAVADIIAAYAAFGVEEVLGGLIDVSRKTPYTCGSKHGVVAGYSFRIDRSRKKPPMLVITVVTPNLNCCMFYISEKELSAAIQAGIWLDPTADIIHSSPSDYWTRRGLEMTADEVSKLDEWLAKADRSKWRAAT